MVPPVIMSVPRPDPQTTASTFSGLSREPPQVEVASVIVAAVDAVVREQPTPTRTLDTESTDGVSSSELRCKALRLLFDIHDSLQRSSAGSDITQQLPVDFDGGLAFKLHLPTTSHYGKQLQVEDSLDRVPVTVWMRCQRDSCQFESQSRKCIAVFVQTKVS